MEIGDLNTDTECLADREMTLWRYDIDKGHVRSVNTLPAELS